jgi:hypothetical protein
MPFVSAACAVTVACAAAVCGVHVPSHSPPPIGSQRHGRIAVENVATTVPLSMVLPQESTRFTSIGTGSPTVAWNPAGSVVNTPFTCEGVQAVADPRMRPRNVTENAERPHQVVDVERDVDRSRGVILHEVEVMPPLLWNHNWHGSPLPKQADGTDTVTVAIPPPGPI